MVSTSISFTFLQLRRIKVVSFEMDEVECVAHEVWQEQERQKAIEAMKVGNTERLIS